MLTCTVYVNLAVVALISAIPFFTLFEFNPTPYVLCTQGAADDKPMAYRVKKLNNNRKVIIPCFFFAYKVQLTLLCMYSELYFEIIFHEWLYPGGKN